MDRRRLEARALDVVERVAAGGRVEDDLVECKAQWIEPAKAARRLAAQANAARGDDIVWIVGLDEDSHRVAPVDGTEVANWWAQVQKRFADGVTPDVDVVSVPTPHGAVVALGFRTDRSPYMVTVDGDGAVDREIPWRTATGVRTAHRGEVLSLLVEGTSPPGIELIRPILTATHFLAGDDTYADVPEAERVQLRLDAKVFFEPAARDGTAAMLPEHQWTARFDLGHAGTVEAALKFSPNTVWGPGPAGLANEAPHAHGAAVRSAGVYVNGPDTLRLQATALLPPERRQDIASCPFIGVALHMPVTGSTRAAAANVELRWSTGEGAAHFPSGTALGTWTTSQT